MPKGICSKTGHAHNWIPRSPVSCPICETKFLPSTSKDGRTKTCGNPDCLKKLFSIQRTGSGNNNYTEALEKQCPVCGITFFEKPGHFKDRVCCSRKCIAIWHSMTKSGSNSHAWKSKVKTYCANCGKELFRLESKLKLRLRTFCSMACKNEWQSKNKRRENHWHWKGGITPTPYCEKFTKEFKERVRAYWGYTCFECGTPEFAHVDKRGKHRKLTVHHVHYDKQMCCNGSPRDVIPLCIGCNTKANKNRDWWEEHFTRLIYMYHPDGKCYLSRDEMKSYINK